MQQIDKLIAKEGGKSEKKLLTEKEPEQSMPADKQAALNMAMK